METVGKRKPVAFNRMPASVLKEKQGNAPLQFVENPNKPGKILFVCGNITGYCSPKVQQTYKTVSLSELEFAEVSKDGNPEHAVPCLMMKGKSTETPDLMQTKINSRVSKKQPFSTQSSSSVHKKDSESSFIIFWVIIALLVVFVINCFNMCMGNKQHHNYHSEEDPTHMFRP